MGPGVEHCKGIRHLGVLDKVDETVLRLNVKGGMDLL